MTTKHAPFLKIVSNRFTLFPNNYKSVIGAFSWNTPSHFYSSPTAPSDSRQQLELAGVEFLFILALCIGESFVSRAREFIVEMVALLTFVTHLTLAYVWVDKFAKVSPNILPLEEIFCFGGNLLVEFHGVLKLTEFLVRQII